MTHDELRLRLELLVQQKILVDQRLSAVNPHFEQAGKDVRHADSTDKSLERLRRLDDKRAVLVAEHNRLEHDIYNVKSELLELERLDRKSYSGKEFCMEFVEVAKEQLPPELYRHIKAEAIKRRS
jgi:negative regulator of sigma E activity